MKISSKGDYGLRALVDLGLHHDAGLPVQVKDIARRQHVPVLAILRRTTVQDLCLRESAAAHTYHI